MSYEIKKKNKTKNEQQQKKNKKQKTPPKSPRKKPSQIPKYRYLIVIIIKSISAYVAKLGRKRDKSKFVFKGYGIRDISACIQYFLYHHDVGFM